MDRVPYNEGGNVRVVQVRQGPPALGAWVRFTADLRRDFEQRWGRVQLRFDSLRFAIEARFDTMDRPLTRAVAADVYFDDVEIRYDAP